MGEGAERTSHAQSGSRRHLYLQLKEIFSLAPFQSNSDGLSISRVWNRVILFTQILGLTRLSFYELYPDASSHNKNMCDWKMKKCFAGSFLFTLYG